VVKDEVKNSYWIDGCFSAFSENSRKRIPAVGGPMK
jgi:hypothetical protein